MHIPFYFTIIFISIKIRIRKKNTEITLLKENTKNTKHTKTIHSESTFFYKWSKLLNAECSTATNR